MALRTMSLLSQWTSRIFSVELNGAVYYFAVQDKQQGGDAPGLFRKVQNRDRFYSILVCNSDRIRRAKFYADLREKLLKTLPPECDVSPMCAFLPSVKDSLIKGYFFKDYSESPSSSELLLRDLTRRYPVLVCSYARGEGGEIWTQNLWPLADIQTKEESMEYYVVPSEAPGYHPSTLSIINSDVFYSFNEALKVLQKVHYMHKPVLW